jgi:MFS family permease
VPGAVFVINTVMIGVGQGLVVRRMTGAVRRRVLHTAITFTAGSFLLLYAADALSVAAGVVVVLVGAVVYTLGELTTGPVVAALSAEAAPPARRGRYMAATQLAWSCSGAVGPLLYSAMLDRGPFTMWGGVLVLCGVWAVLVVVLANRMPLARERVTNVAEADVVGDPQVQPDPSADAPTTS